LRDQYLVYDAFSGTGGLLVAFKKKKYFLSKALNYSNNKFLF
jgi:D-tyrosyl-tRNA(Tyr) deacylase